MEKIEEVIARVKRFGRGRGVREPRSIVVCEGEDGGYR